MHTQDKHGGAALGRGTTSLGCLKQGASKSRWLRVNNASYCKHKNSECSGQGLFVGSGLMIHRAIQHISAVGGMYLSERGSRAEGGGSGGEGRGWGSKKLLTKEVPRQRAETTDLANASGALSANAS